MNVEIVYDSRTGTTAEAANKMGAELESQGHQVRVQYIGQADPAEITQADLICVGSWVQGLFIIAQHPTQSMMQFIDKLGDLSGKQVIVFCTYKLAAGSTMKQMATALEAKGATVIAQFKYRNADPTEPFLSFAKSLA